MTLKGRYRGGDMKEELRKKIIITLYIDDSLYEELQEFMKK